MFRLKLFKNSKIYTMDIENSITKLVLLSLFDKGKSEAEAYDEISKTHNSYPVTLSLVNKWFKVFKSQKDTLDNKNKPGRKPKFTDEFLINLVKENPGLNLSELAKLANSSTTAVTNRLKQVDINGESLYNIVNTNNKRTKRFTDEFLINLINENPNLNLTELGSMLNTTPQNISSRIRRINKDSERVKYTKKDGSKLTDEYLISLINDNPDLNLNELAKISGTSNVTISNKLKHIERDGKTIKYSKKGSQNGAKKFTDEFLIDLIKENPGLNTYDLAKLAGTSQPTISNRLREINKNRPEDDKIVLQKQRSKPKKNLPNINDEYLIKLVDDNPNLNMAELAKLADTSFYNIWKRINQINKNGQKINYITNRQKFTDEFLIQLISDNPELNMKELAALTGTSQATITNRINQINNDNEAIYYSKKAHNYRGKAFTDEFLINLINENPGYSMEKLGKLANVSTSTISKRLNEINKNGERVAYVNKKFK
jgi:DeoR/GlpR family transcriptional regulator of sugar metabolism